MRRDHVLSAKRIESSKSGVQHLCDSCTQHEKCRGIWKHVLRRYGTRQFFLQLATHRMTTAWRGKLQNTYRAALRKVETLSTFPATRNGIFRCETCCKEGMSRAISSASCQCDLFRNAVALQVAEHMLRVTAPLKP